MNVFAGEYRRYRRLLEGSIEQVPDADLFRQLDPGANSIGVIVKHLSGNLVSRFTDFLTTDGEKEWRDRESEFTAENATRVALMDQWRRAWEVLEANVFPLGPEDMGKRVTIRGTGFTVEEALARSLSHFSYHVGQVVYLARHFVGEDWTYLSIPPGGTDGYNQNPDKEKG